MSADGKQLEGLVAFVEETLLPQGFDVKTNSRVFNDDGIQIAEFDVEIRGKIGSTEIMWLIECRDRPGYGPAPGAWIEQLVGRRTRFGFNKVTAVSTTGFATGATEFAAQSGIELREVKSLSPGEFADWLAIQHIHHRVRLTKLEGASFFLAPNETLERLAALESAISKADGNTPILVSTKTGEHVAAKNAFLGAVNSQEGLLDSVEVNGPGRRIVLRVQYTNPDDHFAINTDLGALRIGEIVYRGELIVQETLIPIMSTAVYRRADTGEIISQVVAFAPQEMQERTFSMEIHRVTGAEEMHVIMRKV